MAKYNFFISYSQKDGAAHAQEIKKLLLEKGYTVWTPSTMFVSDTWASAISDALADCDCFLPVITDDYLTSVWAQKELEGAITLSSGRAKRILPLQFTNQPLSDHLQFLLCRYQIARVDSPEKLGSVIDQIDHAFGHELKIDVLYEKLTEYSRLKDDNKEADTICRIIELLCTRWNHLNYPSPTESLTLYKELYQLYERLNKYSWSYDKESKKIVRVILNALGTVSSIIHNLSLEDTLDLYTSSFAIRMLYLDREIRSECADVITSGDVRNPCPVEQHIERQANFVQAFEHLLSEQETALETNLHYTAEDIAFIRETPTYILKKHVTDPLTPKVKTAESTAEQTLSEEEEILLSIANFMQEGNKLFELLQKHGAAGDFLKCLLTSYERLKNYCEVVGATKVASECVDRIVEIRGEIDKHPSSGKGNEKAENGIKSLLGFTLQNSGSYDVFISFKNEDSDLAETIYKYCHRHMKVPFWSKRTLPELSKSEYEDAIYNALRNSRHFIVVLSNLEYLNTNWIKQEMSTFHRAITEGRKKEANFVFVVTDDIYKAIMDSNKMCLDERYCGYQIIKISEYESTLLQYLR